MGFKEALELVLKHEGGYVNHPSDPGGETKYGISKRAYPSEDIKELTKERAGELYKRDYWDRCKCDLMPYPIALCVFDTAVNSGITRASKWLQRCVGANPDAIIGPRTLAKLQIMYAEDPEALIDAYMDARLMFLESLSTFDTFGRGWTRRVKHTMAVALESIETGDK